MNSTPTITGIHEKIAMQRGFCLYEHYSEKEAAQFIGISPQGLKHQRLTGKIAFARISQRRVRFFGFQISEFFIQNLICQDTTQLDTSLETIGFQNSLEVQLGAERGSTNELDKHAALASAQRILRKQNSA